MLAFSSRKRVQLPQVARCRPGHRDSHQAGVHGIPIFFLDWTNQRRRIRSTPCGWWAMHGHSPSSDETSVPCSYRSSRPRRVPVPVH